MNAGGPPCPLLPLELAKTAVYVLNVQKKRSFPRFVVKEMESAYVDELKASINLLMANLESLPVTKGSNAESKYSLQKFKKYSKCVYGYPLHRAGIGVRANFFQGKGAEPPLPEKFSKAPEKQLC